MTLKRGSIAGAGLALLALLAVGIVQLAGYRSQIDSNVAEGQGATRAGTGQPAAASRLTAAQMRAGLAGSPAPLAALHEQGSELLTGGLGAVRARLAALRGYPVVINKWASWCAPCRAEFGIFQSVSLARGREVAFVGIDSGEASRSDAVAFLRSFPVSYPSYYDKSSQAGSAITDSSFTPVTVFYDRNGRQYIHQGPYPSKIKLETDIRRYALDG
jgi:thiol-disulfide isomerase/thioredoxin